MPPTRPPPPAVVSHPLIHTVAVRNLCAFAAKAGDLDTRFTPTPTAEQGQSGHRAIAAKRPAGYRTEVALQGEYRHLRVRGRADGVDDARELLEEVKTYRGALERMPANQRALHWAQAKVYAWLLCAQSGAPAWNVGLVYVHADTLEEAPPLVERCTADELARFFNALCERYLAWADGEAVHRAQRDEFLRALPFAHPQFRAGQRVLAEAVYRAARRGQCLMAQAPTGIGKTVGTLFPMLKAMPEEGLHRVFFLTAKGPGRGIALQAVQTLLVGVAAPCDEAPPQPPAPRLRVVELVARDKACEHPGQACHGDDCPLARGFYDRLGAARAEAAAHPGLLDLGGLREIARRHAVCPYYLGQEMARWCDVVVGDFNHYFDATASLHAMTVADGWRVGVLVDEAHNLIERARDCYSAELSEPQWAEARTAAPALLRKPFDRLGRAWRALALESGTDYQVLPSVPPRFAQAMRSLTEAIGEQLAEGPPAAPPALLEFYFALLYFQRLQESYDPAHSLIDLSAAPASAAASARASAFASSRPRQRKAPRPTLCLRNVTPADFLQPRFAAARSVVLFSATLSPQPFYADTLGVPADAAWLDVETPFRAEQLRVRIVPSLSTRYRHRARSVAPIAALIARQFAERPGNYLAFFSSFDYLHQVAEAFATDHAAVPMWRQTRGMDEAARDAFLARFLPDGQGVGFAVLGGAFAEGIDLPGTRLVGALIATLGLPQFNPVNEALRERLQQRFGAGYEYAYLYPGLRKVVQAAGRVLRTPTDVGSIHLIDERFGRAEVRRLLPPWWRVEMGAG